MDSQLSDIRKEYKKGKLTRNTISENPFEQFARWLDDALHCGEDEPTAMIAATARRPPLYPHRPAERRGKRPIHLLHQLRKPQGKAARGQSAHLPLFRLA